MAKKVKVKATKSTKTNAITETVKAQVDAIVKDFNEKVIDDPEDFYITRFKGNYLYLDRYNGPVCRLKFTGDIDDWDFAIYKYSSERYDSDEWFFPGSEHVDGSIKGALLAGLHAYP